jgi:CO/xanthine dehydrogenase FAD-binding subunit
LAVVRTDRFKIAVGSRPRITKLLVNTNNFLNSQAVINDDVLLQAIEIALEEADLGDNLKASKEYREVLLKSYLKRALKQVIR